jgi:hypothetical protein
MASTVRSVTAQQRNALNDVGCLEITFTSQIRFGLCTKYLQELINVDLNVINESSVDKATEYFQNFKLKP